MPLWRRSEGGPGCEPRKARSCGKARRTALAPTEPAASLLVLFVMTACAAWGATPRAEDILRRTGKVYSRLENYHLVAERETPLRHSIIILDAAPQGRVRLFLGAGGRSLVIMSDGVTAWQYAPGKKKYTRESAARFAANGPRNNLAGRMQWRLVGRFAELWRVARRATLQGRAKVEFQGRKVSCYRIVFRLNGGRDELWISRARFLVLRERRTQGAPRRAGSAKSEEFQIREFDPQASPSPDLFEFTPPAGSRRVAALHLRGVPEGYAGSAAGDFKLRDVRGKRVRLRDFRGKTVLLGFWATWCPACLQELPALEKACKQHPDDMVFLGVDDETRATLRKFLEAHRYRFPVLVDDKRKLFRRFGVHYLPTLLVINPRGIIVRRMVGWKGSQRLFSALQAAER